ncbi:MAG: MAPEG family protein [Gammaproteobacteria bacterium]|nr:MAPEG family protein [Gammaproteobacteria bacterium]
MQAHYIFIPLLAQFVLTFALYLMLLRRKKRALLNGEVNVARRALHEDAWPDYVIQVNNSIRNQFETPVLFYVMVISLYVLNAAGTLAIVFATLYVAARIAHVVVHTGRNAIPARRLTFTLGWCMLMALAVLLLLRVTGV